jgi:hypothetical protein
MRSLRRARTFSSAPVVGAQAVGARAVGAQGQWRKARRAMLGEMNWRGGAHLLDSFFLMSRALVVEQKVCHSR